MHESEQIFFTLESERGQTLLIEPCLSLIVPVGSMIYESSYLGSQTLAERASGNRDNKVRIGVAKPLVALQPWEPIHAFVGGYEVDTSYPLTLDVIASKFKLIARCFHPG